MLVTNFLSQQNQEWKKVSVVYKFSLFFAFLLHIFSVFLFYPPEFRECLISHRGEKVKAILLNLQMLKCSDGLTFFVSLPFFF